MDIIESCLSLVPVPCLSTAFSTLRFIWSSVQQAQASKEQLKALIVTVSHLLRALDGKYREKKLLEAKTVQSLANLQQLLLEISTFVQRELAVGFLKLLLTKDQRIAQIKSYQLRIENLVASFQISALVNIQALLVQNERAREEDQRVLNNHLRDLQSNQNRLIQALNIQQSNQMAMIIALQRKMNQQSGGQHEQQFFTHSLLYLTSSSGRQVKVEEWMVTSYEVEFMNEIGSGGFGQVFKANWGKTMVAVKVLKMDIGVLPSMESIRREVNIWSRLRHPHILQFLGANVMDELPFIVMPYCENGNARKYVRDHPEYDRLKMFHDVALGLDYLHSKNIVHGDLKGLNILIKDDKRAVLCDFGLSRIKADATSRTARVNGTATLVGSRNWMAPERLIGGSLRKPSDIYAFGMTVFEVYTDDIPLGHLDYGDFVTCVVEQDLRPDRPDDEEAPGLSAELWRVAEVCWAKDPARRLTSSDLCDTLANLTTNVDLPDTYEQLQPAIAHTINIPAPSPTPPADSPHQLLGAYKLLVAENEIMSVAFSPNGKCIAAGDRDGFIWVWDVVTGGKMFKPLNTRKGWNPFTFSPDGKHIVSCINECDIQLWDAKSGEKTGQTFEGHQVWITSVAFSPNGKRIVSGSDDGQIRIWDTTTRRTAVVIKYEPKSTWDTSPIVTFSPDSERVFSWLFHDSVVKIWDAGDGRAVAAIPQVKSLESVAYSLDGKHMVAADYNRAISVWDINTGEKVAGPLDGHKGTVLSLAFSPGGKQIASGSYDKTVRVWDAETGQVVAVFEGHTAQVQSVAFSPSGKQIASASSDKTVRIWT